MEHQHPGIPLFATCRLGSVGTKLCQMCCCTTPRDQSYLSWAKNSQQIRHTTTLQPKPHPRVLQFCFTLFRLFFSSSQSWTPSIPHVPPFSTQKKQTSAPTCQHLELLMSWCRSQGSFFSIVHGARPRPLTPQPSVSYRVASATTGGHLHWLRRE